MGSVLIQLLPPVIGSMLMPTWILLVLFLLKSGHGLAEAMAFVAGVTVVRLMQGLVFGTVLSASPLPLRKSASETIVSIVLVATGLVMWVTAVNELRKMDDSTSLLSRWMTTITSLTPIKAFGLGASLVITSSRAWLFTLAAISIIGDAGLTLAQGLVAYLLYICGAELLIAAPIVVSARSPGRFDTAARWLDEHERPIVIAVSLVVGGLFLWRGLLGLIS